MLHPVEELQGFVGGASLPFRFVWGKEKKRTKEKIERENIKMKRKEGRKEGGKKTKYA